MKKTKVVGLHHGNQHFLVAKVPRSYTLRQCKAMWLVFMDKYYPDLRKDRSLFVSMRGRKIPLYR